MTRVKQLHDDTQRQHPSPLDGDSVMPPPDLLLGDNLSDIMVPFSVSAAGHPTTVMQPGSLPNQPPSANSVPLSATTSSSSPGASQDAEATSLLHPYPTTSSSSPDSDIVDTHWSSPPMPSYHNGAVPATLSHNPRPGAPPASGSVELSESTNAPHEDAQSSSLERQDVASCHRTASLTIYQRPTRRLSIHGRQRGRVAWLRSWGEDDLELPALASQRSPISGSPWHHGHGIGSSVRSQAWAVNWNEERLSYLDQLKRVFMELSIGCRGLFLKAEGWVFAALIAVLTAVAAGWIEVCVKYLSDLRIGTCRGMIWQPRSFCCGSRAAVDFENNACFVNQGPIIHMDRVEHARWVAWSQVFQIYHTWMAYLVDYTAYIIIAIALAVLAAWLCQTFAPLAAGSGIPEVKTILGGFVMNGVLGGWTALIKIIGLSLSAASGLALGKEGPLVHIACCFANLVGALSVKYNENEGKRRELLSAASAAGVSVAFGAPLGGVLFSLEEVSSYFPPKTLWKSFFCAVVGALTLKWLDATETGRLTLFQMDSVSLLGTWQLVELIPFAVIGLIGGSIGTLFIRLNVKWMQKKKLYPKIASHPMYEVIVVTALCNLLNYPVAILRVPFPTLLEQMFSRCGVSPDPDIFSLCSMRSDDEYAYSDYALKWPIFAELLFAAVIRFIQTVFTFGMFLPAGLFIPSLTIGALCGRLVGLTTIKLNAVFGFIDCHKCLHPGVYAIVGAAAMLGGVTRVTISIVVIMFELTGGLSYVVPFMVAVMVAKWIGDALCEHSIYDCFIRLKGYPYLHMTNAEAFTAKACDIMETKLAVITLEGNTVGSLERKLGRYTYYGFPLITSRRDRILVGFVVATDLRKALDIALSEYPEVNETTPVRFLQDLSARRQPPRGFSIPFHKDFGSEEANDNERGTSAVAPSTPHNGSSQFVLDLSHVVDTQAIQLVPEAPLGQIHNIFRQLGLRFCLLTHRGRLEGLLTKHKFLSYVENLHQRQ